MHKITATLLLALSCWGVLAAQSAGTSSRFWQVSSPATVAAPEHWTRPFEPDAYYAAQLNYADLRDHLARAPREFTAAGRNQPLQVDLPQADGSLETFAVVESPLMGPALQAKYPLLRTYSGFSTVNPAKVVKITISPEWGLKVLIRRPDHGIEFVERMFDHQNQWYMVYDRLAFPAQYWHLDRPVTTDFVADPTRYDDHRSGRQTATPAGPADRGAVLEDPVKLKIYRFACATTGEFAQDHGGTTPTVLAAMVNYTNQLNAVYEGDLRIRLVLIDEVESILFLDPATDPYTGTTVGSHMNQNPTAMASVLGDVSKYDIGHVFSRYIQGDPAAGVAGGQCCTDFGKGRGCSSGNLPYGAYFLSVVGQEIGHQWAGGHTWTYCDVPTLGPGDAPISACEPGSGSTIMSYAGVCATNVQNVADLYYHVCSIVEIRDFVENGFGNTCGTEVVSDNRAPVVTIPYPNNFFIPISTPFELNGSAVDPDGDPLTYCWEEADRGPLVPIGQPTGSTPLFRTFPANTSTSRTFPRIQNIVNNQSSINEILPSYTRDLTFCLTARDNKLGGAGVGIDTIEMKVTATAGPFRVTYPTLATEEWHPGEYQYVTWDVANTNGTLVNCQSVNIRLSTNGGITYPITLVSGVPNSGSACILVPNNLSNTVRVRVEAADNVFFDISNANFKIVAATTPGYAICASEPSIQACLPNAYTTTISNSAWLNFSENITYAVTGLPAGATATFNQNPAPAGTDVSMSIDFGANPVEGNYSLTVTATGATLNDEATIDLRVVSNDFSGFALQNPANGSVGVSQLPWLNWSTVPDADRYEVQLATSASFAPSTILVNNANVTNDSLLAAANLDKGTVYYWRVRAVNPCTTTEWEGPFAFATLVEACTAFNANDLPKNISTSGTPTIESIINIGAGGTISDVNVVNITGSHDAFSQLRMTLVSPQGTEVILFQNKCGFSSLSINAGFDDQGAQATFPCPPTGGVNIRPQQLLSALNGQNAQGNWTLRVRDNAVGEGGAITNFELQICSASSTNPPTLLTNNVLTVSNGANALVTDGFLKATDPDNTAEELVFTVLEIPTNGHLHLNGLGIMAAGDEFRQSDIDQNRLRYYDWGSSPAGDNFRFAVTDGNGGLVTGTFEIAVNVVGTTSAYDALRFRLAPNPAHDMARLTFGQALASEATVQVRDASGRTLRSVVLPAGTLQHDVHVAQLPRGVYVVSVQHPQGVFVQKLVVE
jgi:subtilisin-like proprotein convertase family protein